MEQTVSSKSLLFWRRIEYLSLFFITYTSIRSRKDLYLLVKTAFATMVIVVLYAMGQKYLYWPAFSTMNREFSKGMRLYLTPSSRVMSTFGGHYDFAAYLMMLLTLMITGFWVTKNKLIKLGLIAITIPAYWSLILTASRTSFLGYLTGLTISAIILARLKGKWIMFANWFVMVALSMTVMLTMGDLSERFFQVLEQPDVLVHEITQVTPIQRDTLSKMVANSQGKLLKVKTTLQDFKDKISSFKFSFSKPPSNSISTDELAVVVSSDTYLLSNPIYPPTSLKQKMTGTSLESVSATVAATSNGGYSPNAPTWSRWQSARRLWPRLSPDSRNPLDCYSTLTKTYVDEFTLCGVIRQRLFTNA
jgi:hypothetical protein